MIVSRVLFSRCVLALALGALAAGCGKSATADAGAAAGGGRGRGDGGASVPVSTARVSEKSLPLTVSTVGTGEAVSTVEVRAQVTGQLMTVNFKEGDDVTEGQLLFTLDVRPYDVALAQAQAALAKDQAQSDNAQAQLKRQDDLLTRGLISRADHDTQAAAVQTLIETTNADRAMIDNAKLNLQYTHIVAPLTGRTGSLLVHQGSLIRSADTTPLVVINQFVPVRVSFAIPGQFLGKIREGQAAAPLVADALPQGESTPVRGDVTFIDNTIDPATGTIRLKATFANENRRLWPGEIVQVTLRLAVEPHAVVVPTAAVQTGQQGQYVFVVNADKTVAMRPVTVSRMTADDAIISAGVKVGEEVVTDGQLRLTPGARVSIKPPVVGKVAP